MFFGHCEENDHEKDVVIKRRNLLDKNFSVKFNIPRIQERIVSIKFLVRIESSKFLEKCIT